MVTTYKIGFTEAQKAITCDVVVTSDTLTGEQVLTETERLTEIALAKTKRWTVAKTI